MRNNGNSTHDTDIEDGYASNLVGHRAVDEEPLHAGLNMNRDQQNVPRGTIRSVMIIVSLLLS